MTFAFLVQGGGYRVGRVAQEGAPPQPPEDSAPRST
jgi:hypothetical protein